MIAIFKIDKMKVAIIFVLSIFLWWSCGTKHNHEQSETSEHEHTEFSSGQGSSMSLPDRLKLNNGERWAANAETTSGIKEMLEIISKYNPDDLQAVRELGMPLQQELDGIINKCTMKGEAHEQLHIYLVPLIKQIKILKEQEPSETQVHEIKSYLDQYYNYFK